MRLYNETDVAELLTVDVCIEAMDQAMRAVSADALNCPPRQFIPFAQTGGNSESLIGVMPCVSETEGFAVTKVLSLLPQNAARALPVVQGFVALIELETGRCLAVMDGAAITARRTAAASALATRILAREDASTCGIFGAGVQAITHIEAILAVRPISEVRIWARSRDKADALAERMQSQFSIDTRAFDEPQPVAACDVVSTVTGSPQPILKSDWVSEGAHVNLVGAHGADCREADSDLIARACVYVDALSSLEHEGGDVLIPIREGLISRDHIRGEIGALLRGSIEGRGSDDAITVYNSVGLAAQDLFAAMAIYRAAQP